MKPHLAFNEKEIPRSTVIKVFTALVIVAFLLRIAYAGHLFEDDGLWFTAGEEILRGKALYSEIYFDKPPVLPLLYALLFKLFGAHILTIRLFAAAYSVAVAFVLYRFGALLYDQRKGLLAAVLYVVGSTTYTTGQFQGFNTDCLMTLPYTLAAYLFVRSGIANPLTKARRAWLALASGIALGLAFQTNPKALFDLLFFVLCSLFFAIRSRTTRAKDEPSSAAIKNQEPGTRNQEPSSQSQGSVAYSLGLAVCGCLAGALPFWVYMAATNSVDSYWFSVWKWGALYANYYSWEVALETALRQSLSYFALNNLFFVGLLFVILTTVRTIRQKRSQATATALAGDFGSQRGFNADAILLLWFIASYVGMSVGGRFFGHYFLQILPSLCLLTARGITGLFASLHSSGKAISPLRRMVFVLLAMGVLLTLARYHTRSVILVADWARGAKSEMTGTWFYERMQREDRYAAATVKEMELSAAEVDGLGLEALRHHQPPLQTPQEGENYLFVWGYRPEIYYWSGLPPASRYLSSQLLTGVPADVNYFGDDFTVILDEKTTAAHRTQLLRDLQQTRPPYIIDELAAYNSALAMDNYPELKEFLGDYKMQETETKVFVYALRKPKDKKKPPVLSNQ